MATTLKTNLIVPDVWADAVGPTILGKAVLAQLADADDQLVGVPGDSVQFPKFDYIGDASDLTENVAMTASTLTMTDSKATVKEVGKAVELTDTATLAALGNPNNQAQTQIALAVARKIDADLRTAAEVTESGTDSKGNSKTWAPLAVPVADVPLSWNRLTQGFALLGDEYDPAEIAGIVVHSTQHMQLLNDPNFISVDKFGQGAVIMRGQVGNIGGIPVLISDRATEVVTVPGEVGPPVVDEEKGYRALIVRKGALALKYKRRPLVETDRDILKRTNIITTNVHYAVKRVDDRGVVIVPTNKKFPTS